MRTARLESPTDKIPLPLEAKPSQPPLEFKARKIALLEVQNPSRECASRLEGVAKIGAGWTR
jgi:hypothetical protein